MDSASIPNLTLARGATTRHYPCWIESFNEICSGHGIPPAFVQWAGIFTIASALGRHCFIRNLKGQVFPNLYVLMVGPPGTGKSEAESLIRGMLLDAKVNLSATHVSKASLIDEMKAAAVHKILNGKLYDYHYLTILSSEFVETFPEYDTHLLGMLCRWWDCPPELKENKRSLKEPITIPFPAASILTGIQPGLLTKSFPPEAWSGGFLSRTIFVYVPQRIELLLRAKQGAKLKDTAGRKIPIADYGKLVDDLKRISEMHGCFEEDESFIEAYLAWKARKGEPRPKHPRLFYYSERREHQIEKLSIISAASRGSMTLTSEDHQRACDWLESSEANLDDIFVEMSSGDDMALMGDLQNFVLRFGRDKGVPEAVVKRYLTARVATQRMDSFLAVANDAGFIELRNMGSQRVYFAKMPDA